MSDEYGGEDLVGEPEHEPANETVGAIGGIHGVTLEEVDSASHTMDHDGTAVPDAHIPPAHHHSAADGFVQEKLHEGYDAVTHPDPDAHQPNPITEQVDHERHAEEATDGSGTHIIHAPEQHF